MFSENALFYRNQVAQRQMGVLWFGSVRFVGASPINSIFERRWTMPHIRFITDEKVIKLNVLLFVDKFISLLHTEFQIPHSHYVVRICNMHAKTALGAKRRPRAQVCTLN